MLYPVSREKAGHRCDLLTNSMFASSSRVGARPSSIIRSMRAYASRTLEITPRGTRIVNYSRRAQLFPYRRVLRRAIPVDSSLVVGFNRLATESLRVSSRRRLGQILGQIRKLFRNREPAVSFLSRESSAPPALNRPKRMSKWPILFFASCLAK